MKAVLVEPSWANRLDAGVKSLDLRLAPEARESLLQFVALLAKWNRAYNLTAVRDPLEMVDRHLLDSLSILPYLRGGQILDLGTGAGLPGIPLALLRPQWQFVLLDSSSKKLRFVRQTVLELGLANVQTVHTRVERFRPERPFDTLISRAFAPLPRMLELTRNLLAPHAVLLAMKGKAPVDEIRGLPRDLQAELIPLQVPFADGKRHLVRITQTSELLR